LPQSSPHEASRGGRRAAALALATVLLTQPLTAACAHAQAAAPFPVVAVEAPRPERHWAAYAAWVTGAALVGGSFLLTERANSAYDDYLRETDPTKIEGLYDRAVMDDRLSSASLVGGELLIVTGLYLRFLRNPRSSRLALEIGPERCALALRF
jgi:hypothetical protein